MNIGRTVKVFTAEPLVSPVPADETRTDVVSEAVPATPAVPVADATSPTRTTVAAAR